PTIPSKRSASRIGSSWSAINRFGRRSLNVQLYRAKLLGTCGGKCLYCYRCRPLDHIWTKSSSEPAGRGNPHGGAADAGGPGVDDALLARLTAMDRYYCIWDGAFCRARGSTAPGAATLWLVVLRVGHQLHDDVVGSGDSLRLINRPAAKS